MAEELQTVTLSDGCKIKCKILGDSPNKPLMIAHHGAPGISTHKEPAIQFGDFTDTFRILVFDMRGSGHSDKKRPYSHKRWVEDIEELRQWTGVDKFVMIGASHGGFLTLEYALAYPQHLYGIIAGDTGAQFAHWAVMSAMKTALTDPRGKAVDPDQMLRMMSGTMTSQEDLESGFATIGPLYAVPDDLQDKVETNPMAALDGAFIPFYETVNASQGEVLSRYDIRDRLHEIKMPVFVYCGRYDFITPPKLNEDTAKAIEGAKFIVYENSGHMPALEEKTAFQRDAREFLKTLNAV